MTASKAYDRTSRLALTDGMHVISRKRLKEAVARQATLKFRWTRGFGLQRRLGGKVWQTYGRPFRARTPSGSGQSSTLKAIGTG